MNDKGHELTDAILADLESRIKKEYAQAVRETQGKLEDYLRRFETKDETWRLWVASGEKTEAEYKAWRQGQIMGGYRWEAMKSQLAEDYHSANAVARSIINGYMPEAYALNHNYGTYLVERGGRIDTGYTLYSRETVERILRDEPDLLKMPGQRKKQEFADFDAYKAGEPVNLTPEQKRAFDKLIGGGKDIRWQEGQIQSVTLQSVLQGESIPNMAKRIARTMGETNHKATIRYARTAMTGAENAGRVDAYRRAEGLGIEMDQQWVATLDNRTRHSHRRMDGETAGVGETFSNGCAYPGDSDGPPEEIWNCRCTLIPNIKGFPRDMSDLSIRRSEKLDDMSYEEWLEGHGVSESITKQEETGEAARRGYVNEYKRK